MTCRPALSFTSSKWRNGLTAEHCSLYPTPTKTTIQDHTPVMAFVGAGCFTS